MKRTFLILCLSVLSLCNTLSAADKPNKLRIHTRDFLTHDFLIDQGLSLSAGPNEILISSPNQNFNMAIADVKKITHVYDADIHTDVIENVAKDYLLISDKILTISSSSPGECALYTIGAECVLHQYIEHKFELDLSILNHNTYILLLPSGKTLKFVIK